MLTETNKLEEFWDKEFDIWAKKQEDWGHYSDVIKFNDILKDVNGKHILDIGCGDGIMMDFFSKKGAIIYGIEISQKMVDFNMKFGRNVRLGDVRDIPFGDNFFDAVYSLGVVEHFDETFKAIKEHFRVTRSGGKIIIQVPYRFSLFRLLNFAWYFVRGMTKYGIASYGKSYTKDEIVEIVKKAGGKNVKAVVHYPTCWLRILHVPLNKRIARIMERCLSRMGLMIWVEAEK
jgi:ubiquinone/menaquinone biosynthesis C-methylase UbiE